MAITSRSMLVFGFFLLASTANADWPGDGYGPGGGNGRFGNGCGWWGGSNCEDGSDNNSNGSGSGSDTNANYTLSEADMSRNARIVTIHAVLACLVWVFLIPVGGILIRSGIKSPWILRAHAALQSISYVIYVVAVAMGIWLVKELSYGPYSLWDDAHPKLGLAILVIATISPITGIVHHVLYKRRAAKAKQDMGAKQPGRTIPGYVHLWFGRALILMGMVNGGLGLRLAAKSPYNQNGQAKTIAYGVGAAVMLIAYIVFVVLGELRRKRERKQNNQSVYVPMNSRDVDASQGLPGYEDSQEAFEGKRGTVARYS